MRKRGYIIQFLTEQKGLGMRKAEIENKKKMMILKTQAPKRIHGLNFDFDLL